ncbi:MAG: 4-vinyl reductase [Deltaproteobacteria bacterium]|jgi:predicted hydrocarbon binding protein|nr:4-vinyl reductase [Deltaproteobacteria bacterium]
MDNIFINKQNHCNFAWENLGNIIEGRGDLGEEMPVLVYRLMQYTMLHVLALDFGPDKANDYFRDAGKLAGTEFAKNCLNLKLPLNDFIAELQSRLKELKVCVLRLEEHDPETGQMVLTAAQDLDCSGIPVTNETVCCYDEGFFAGIMEAYSGKVYLVREVDCWANGNRVCRFKGGPVQGS